GVPWSGKLGIGGGAGYRRVAPASSGNHRAVGSGAASPVGHPGAAARPPAEDAYGRVRPGHVLATGQRPRESFRVAQTCYWSGSAERAMIIWSGWGFLVAVVGFGCFLLTEIGVGAVMRDDQYYQNNSWPKLVAFLAAAVIVWPLGRALNRRRPGRELIDPKTGGRVVLTSGGGHSLFFIPMEYWAPLLVVLGVVLLFVR